MELMINNIAVDTALFTANSSRVDFAAPVAVAAGDLVGFRTDLVVGGMTDARVAAIYRRTITGLKGDQGDPGAGETSFAAVAEVPGTQNINATTTVQFTTLDGNSEAGWALAANALSYTGTPSKVRLGLNLQLFGAVARAAPGFRIQRNGVDITSQVRHTYIRNGSGHNESSANMFFIDLNPGTNPSYTVVSQQLAGVGVVTCQEGDLTCEAVE